MTDPIQITIGGPPVPKGRPRLTNAGGFARAYTPAKTRKYEAHARLAASQAMDGRAPLEGPVDVIITAYLPIPKSWSKKRQRKAETGVIDPSKRPDIDNFTKAVLDALNGIVLRDDAQVVHEATTKVYARIPRLEVRVSPRSTEAA